MAKVKINKHFNYVPPKIVYGAAKRPQRAVPRQSMSLDDVMRRFQRGLPVDQKVHPNVYLKGKGAVDFERLSKLDFDAKAALAAEERAKAQRLIEQAKEAKQAKEKRAEKERDRDDEYRERNRGRRPQAVEDLDATLPDDTEHVDRGVRNGRVRKSSNR